MLTNQAVVKIFQADKVNPDNANCRNETSLSPFPDQFDAVDLGAGCDRV
jgi:hypothetical protein